MNLFKKGLTKEIFVIILAVMLVFTALINTYRNAKKVERSKQDNPTQVFNKKIKDNPLTTLYQYDSNEAINRRMQELRGAGTSDLNNSQSDDASSLFQTFLEKNKGKKAVIVFWAEWSRESVGYLEVINQFASRRSDVAILAVHQGEVTRENELLFKSKNYVFDRIADITGNIFLTNSVIVVPSTIFMDASHQNKELMQGVLSYDQIRTSL